jgi:hypothetical protein
MLRAILREVCSRATGIRVHVDDVADMHRNSDATNVATIDRPWLLSLTGACAALAPRTPMSPEDYKEATKNVVFRTPQKQKAVVANEAPTEQKQNHVVLPCKVRWYNKEKGWGYASPQQICRPDVRLSAAVVHAAGLSSVNAGEMFMVTFERSQSRPNAIMLSPMTSRSYRQQDGALDLLDDCCLYKIMEFVRDGGAQSLCSVARFCIASRRAFVLEKDLQYGHILLGCELKHIPPVRWFQQRTLRISSITSAVLPQNRLAASHPIVHPIQIQLESKRSEDYRSIKM